MSPIEFLCRRRSLTTQLEQRRRKLYLVAYTWSKDRMLADDLAQETLTKAVRNLGSLRDAIAMDAWLFQILTNCWRDYLRRRRDIEDIDALGDDEPVCETNPNEGEIVSQVRAAIARLPGGQREVLALVELMGFSYAEVAAMLEIPIGTVTSRICRAREALRAMLVDLETDQGTVVQLPEAK